MSNEADKDESTGAGGLLKPSEQALPLSSLSVAFLSQHRFTQESPFCHYSREAVPRTPDGCGRTGSAASGVHLQGRYVPYLQMKNKNKNRGVHLMWLRGLGCGRYNISCSCCLPVNEVNVSSLQALSSSMEGTTGVQQGGGPEQSQSSKNLLASVATDRPRGKFHRHNHATTSNQPLPE